MRASEVRQYLGITDVIDAVKRVEHDLARLLERTRHMATQDQVNALAERVSTGVSDIRQDIEELKAANPQLDLSSLEASVAGLESLDAENPVAGGGDTPPAG